MGKVFRLTVYRNLRRRDRSPPARQASPSGPGAYPARHAGTSKRPSPALRHIHQLRPDGQTRPASTDQPTGANVTGQGTGKTYFPARTAPGVPGPPSDVIETARRPPRYGWPNPDLAALRRDPVLAHAHHYLLAPIRRHHQLPAPPGVPGQALGLAAGPLSLREQEVLRHVSRLLSTAGGRQRDAHQHQHRQAHLAHINRKLATTRRAEAVRRGRRA